jgi:hypothetical protein
MLLTTVCCLVLALLRYAMQMVPYKIVAAPSGDAWVEVRAAVMAECSSSSRGVARPQLLPWRSCLAVGLHNAVLGACCWGQSGYTLHAGQQCMWMVGQMLGWQHSSSCSLPAVGWLATAVPSCADAYGLLLLLLLLLLLQAGGQQYSPSQIGAFVLTKMKETAGAAATALKHNRRLRSSCSCSSS